MKPILIITAFFLLVACSGNSVDKPKKLIEEEVMIDIFHDLSVLEAMKSHNPGKIQSAKEPEKFVYKKYGIDSLQFAQSNRYYASDVKKYRRMYARALDRLKADQAVMDSIKINQKKQPQTTKKKKIKQLEQLPDAPTIK